MSARGWRQREAPHGEDERQGTSHDGQTIRGGPNAVNVHGLEARSTLADELGVVSPPLIAEPASPMAKHLADPSFPLPFADSKELVLVGHWE